MHENDPDHPALTACLAAPALFAGHAPTPWPTRWRSSEICPEGHGLGRPDHRPEGGRKARPSSCSPAT